MSTLAKLVLLLVVFALGSAAGVKWQLGVQARIDLERVADERRQERENRQIEREDSNQVIGALNASKARAHQNQVAADAARSERDLLRDDLADAQRRNSTAPLAACREHATTLSSVFDQCTERYTDLARKAQGHANDALMFEQAWTRRSEP